jgi:murein L,D-transpeptidase YcbB/YkuD
MNGSTTLRVDLAQPIPDSIVYATVIIRDDGLVYFYDDIYGLGTAVKKALAKVYPSPQ